MTGGLSCRGPDSYEGGTFGLSGEHLLPAVKLFVVVPIVQFIGPSFVQGDKQEYLFSGHSYCVLEE